MVSHEEKASRYIGLLDAARVNATWSEVPELIRKVKKHAPQRKVLAHTATAEHHIATTTVQDAAATQPETSPLTNLLNILKDQDGQPEEDVFQARSCLLWARWIGVLSNDDAVASASELALAVRKIPQQPSATWTKICVVKSSYMQGMRYKQSSDVGDARSILSFAIPFIDTNKELVLTAPQFAYWSQQVLIQLAFSFIGETSSQTGAERAKSLELLRSWAAIASKTTESSTSAIDNPSAHVSRLTVWRRYYQIVTDQLRAPSSQRNISTQGIRIQQSEELIRVERAYENELLKVRKFPKATESNQAIEEWVEQVVGNWRLLCSPDWRDTDLAEGGRDALGRNVLDILYRAATKTFHSTLILRRLFQVHKSLAEFELAYRSLDTWLELVERASVRAAKSAHKEPGQEPNDVVLSTLAEAIEGLCEIGRVEEAKKAHHLCSKLEDWLSKLGIEGHSSVLINGSRLDGSSISHNIPDNVLETVYRAIGVGKANWARWTSYSERRSGLQEEAIEYLKRACAQQGREAEPETLYATSLLLAETREITEAIVYAKRGLERTASQGSGTTQWVGERKAVQLWHLLALLLSARQEFDNAARSCVAAFEQLPPSSILIGAGNYSSSVVSSKTDQTTKAGLVQEMECNELQGMIEIRITELALTELIEGPEEAVNCSNELLTVFSRMFAHLDLSLDTLAADRNPKPPLSAGTVKTSRSMFGRKKTTTGLADRAQDTASLATNTTRPGTGTTQAPTIQVTDEEGKHAEGKHHHHSLRHSIERTRNKRKSLENNQKKLTRKSSLKNAQGLAASSAPAAGTTTIANQVNFADPAISLNHAESADAKQELRDVQHNLAMHDEMPPPASHDEQPPQQDIRLPTIHPLTNSTSPLPRFAKKIAQQHALTVLVKVWLIIATLYRRSNMFDDSKEACEEAGKIASKIETSTSSIENSARAFAKVGWGSGGKSVDEIWADIHCERAELQLAIHGLRQSEVQVVDNGGLRKAANHFEQCLMFSPNHLGGVVGLSNLLLDYYEKKIDLGKRVDDGRPEDVSIAPANVAQPTMASVSQASIDSNMTRTEQVNGHIPVTPAITTNGDIVDHADSPIDHSTETDDLRKTPENLNRIAARDRAYGLLSTLTKLGSGWDNSEAWYALARAHELGGEIEKAKSILWWCIELEDTRPIRHWRNLGYRLG